MTPPRFLDLAKEYLALRRALGFDLEWPGQLLLEFAQHVDGIDYCGPVTTDLAVRWALATGSGSMSAPARRLSAVRQFARYRAAFDPGTEVPLHGILGRRPRGRHPHIYSEEEVASLLTQAGLLRTRGGLRPKTYVAFFSLLVSTGLRLSEACRLVPDDVDLTHGVLTVRGTKFRKSRLVPLHPSATEALSRYMVHRNAPGTRPGCFFRTEQAPALKRTTVEKTFSRMRHRLGWTGHGRVRRPRIHDLRHTFAVRRLLRWYEGGADIDCKMLALATYLGHAKVTDTYWYLSAVPELMTITSERFERFARRVEEHAS
jgi:integrase